MLVNVRPSNEALLRARVPGAQDQRGCPSHPFHRARSVSKKGIWPLPSPFQAPLIVSSVMGLIDLPLRASNEGSPRPRVARAQKIIRLHPLSVPRAGGRPGCPFPHLSYCLSATNTPMVYVAWVSQSPLIGQAFQEDTCISN
jgi:hypothetical protein